jgi:hypothetical protein
MASLVVDTCGSHRCVAVARRVTLHESACAVQPPARWVLLEAVIPVRTTVSTVWVPCGYRLRAQP